MIYMYGVAWLGCFAFESSTKGVFGGLLGTVGHEGFSVIIEQVDAGVIDATLGEGAKGNETLLHTAVLAHQAVLNVLVTEGDLLPFRFGTVVDDETAAVALLAEEKEGFESALTRVSGHLEWGVKIIRTEEKSVAAKPASGADYLRQLSAQRTTVADTQGDISRLCDGVAQSVYAQAKLVSPLPLRSSDNRERRILNLACLLPRGGQGALNDAINDAAGRFGTLPIQIEISGPWPPFSFSSTRIDEAVE
jgi:hypothetical protein